MAEQKASETKQICPSPSIEGLVQYLSSTISLSGLIAREKSEPSIAYFILDHKEALLPVKGSEMAAGFDLFSAEHKIIPGRGRGLVNTGLRVKTPPGTYGRIAPRSGLALKKGIDVGAGVIDADYQGLIGVVIFNHDEKEFEINAGERIAQLIFEKYDSPVLQVVKSFEDVTKRGESGFGSSGTGDLPKRPAAESTEKKS
jgi:dUTP pyrophosphatase